MKTTNTLFLWPILIAIYSLIGFSYGATCIESEREALLELKDGLTDPSNRLASWAGNGDCCTWSLVICDNSTGHVLELHLRTPSIEEYFRYDPSYYYEYMEYAEDHKKAVFGGKISPSLVHLKHLRYLDFSNNEFGGIQIPTFFGLMERLIYLDLSWARFGGMIPNQLGNLSNLQHLNLEGGNLGQLHVDNLDWLSNLSSLQFLDLGFVSLFKFSNWFQVINSLPSLVELRLSACDLTNFPPLVNANFTSLVVLDLSYNSMLQVESLGWVSALSKLQTLDMRFIDLSKSSDWLKVINSFPSLKELYLSGCGLSDFPPLVNANFSSLSILDLAWNSFTGSFAPSWVSGLKNIISLDLSFNKFQGPIPDVFQNITNSLIMTKLILHDNHFNSSIPNWLYSFNGLQILDLGSNKLQGTISSDIANLTSLTSLDLSNNEFEGAIPKSLKNLCNLRSLSLSGAKLSQEINEVLEILSGCVSDGLKLLTLSSCQLSGHLTDDLVNFKNLTDLVVSYNSISGPVPSSLGEMSSLRNLALQDNKFNGTLPLSFGLLTKLEHANISCNSFEGNVSQFHFANLTNLRSFYASTMRNDIELRVSSKWITPLHLEELDLRSWHIGPQFPSWLHSLKHLQYIDLSNTSISSAIPIWFWNLSSNCSYLNLSHNQIHGVIPNIPYIGNSYSLIDLHSNNFSGPLPYFSSNLSALDMSNNSISGSMSNFLCHKMSESRNMQLLNLGENLLSGEIPDCWMQFPYLVAIKLSNNRFSGNIPESIGTLSLLESLHLDHNNLSGEMPVSLGNCTSLVTLDFTENKVAGNIPAWIGERFSSMFILSLRANKFDGHIPKELCRVTSLRILDLAHNNLSGTMPSCFNTFSAMTRANGSTGTLYLQSNSSGSFFESTLLVMKGQLAEYITILGFVRIIDLSSNNLSGKIPVEITSLAGLQSLNLSQNGLSGKIPKDIGAMRSLESLDFSQNHLVGEIPKSISNLSFLSFLNLSNNKLQGKIPTGTQLQSFDPSSFSGNQLCGLPLTKKCSGEGGLALPPGVENGKQEDHGHKLDWFHFYVSIAPGFAVGFWFIVGPLFFSRQWRFAYFRFLDNLWNKIWWSFIYKLCRS